MVSPFFKVFFCFKKSPRIENDFSFFLFFAEGGDGGYMDV